jgi:hypothetical protein
MEEKMHPILAMIMGGARVEVRKPQIVLTEEEKDLANALIIVVQKHGKFNQDKTGVWAGYEEPSSNAEARIGVKCENCVLYEGADQCKIIALPVAPEGKCRFAVIPDGVVQWASGGNV